MHAIQQVHYSPVDGDPPEKHLVLFLSPMETAWLWGSIDYDQDLPEGNHRRKFLEELRSELHVATLWEKVREASLSETES